MRIELFSYISNFCYGIVSIAKNWITSLFAAKVYKPQEIQLEDIPPLKDMRCTRAKRTGIRPPKNFGRRGTCDNVSQPQ